MMKFSTAAIRGFKKVDGRQCTHWLFDGESPEAPTAVCVNGAACLGSSGNAWNFSNWNSDGVAERFREEYGFTQVELNNGQKGAEPMDWQDIVGMAKAIGL